MTQSPKTILYVHSSDEMYGADLILLQLLQGLPRTLIRPIVVIPTDVPYEGQLTAALQQSNVTVVHFPTAILRRSYFSPFGLMRYLWRFVLTVRFLLRLIKREHVDLVHSNTAAVIPGAVAARLSRVPHVWHVHEIIMSPRALWRFTSWLIPRLSAQVVAVSQATKDHLVAGNALNAQKTAVIHNGIQTARFDAASASGVAVRHEWAIEDDQPLIGMIGRFSHWKGQPLFIQMAAIVSQQIPEARFALVGGTFPGQENLVEEARAQINALGLADKVILSGFRSDVPALLNAFDLFVLPSTLPDPFPTVVLEAMAARCPVVANAHGGSVEMVAHQHSGLLVPPNDAAAMAQAVVDVIGRADRGAALGVAGRQRLDRLYSREAFIASWATAYQKLLTSEQRLAQTY